MDKPVPGNEDKTFFPKILTLYQSAALWGAQWRYFCGKLVGHNIQDSNHWYASSEDVRGGQKVDFALLTGTT